MKIRNSNPKHTSGGYERLVGNKQIASVFTKAQSTVISNGTELEHIICSQSNCIADLDKFLDDVNNSVITNGTYLCTKRVLGKSSYNLKGCEPDFLIFVVSTNRVCNIIELKDGDYFDTKKAKAELEALQNFGNNISSQIAFVVKRYICCFNQNDKAEIVKGFKNVIDIDNVMTGKELCDLLDIDYQKIVDQREKDTIDNLSYVVEELSKVSEVQDAVHKIDSSHISDSDFYDD